jgi:FtsH-binding integral membrane protein
MNPYQQSASQIGYSRSKSQAVDGRARFIVRTYNHLFGALALFTLIEVVLFKTGVADSIALSLLSTGRGWLLVMGGFMLVGWLASHTAATARSMPAQYAALAGYVAAEAIIFVPLLYLAERFAPSTIRSAAAVSLLGFGGLTAIVFVSRKDFSFLGTFLRWSGVAALLLITAGLLFGFQLGTFFSVAMIGFAGAAILYDTSNVVRNFPEDRYVAASLQLFASVALLFWYVLRLLMSLGRD